MSWDAWQKPYDPTVSMVVPDYDQYGFGQSAGAGMLPVDSLGTSSLVSTGGMPDLGKLNIPESAGGGGLFSGMTGGQKINAGLQTIQTLAGLWAAWQSLKQGKKQARFEKQFARANLGNQIKSYNTALTDRITTRAQLQGMSQAEANAYLQTHSLNKKGT